MGLEFLEAEGAYFAPKGGHNRQQSIAGCYAISGDPELLFLRLDVDKIDEAHGGSGFPTKWEKSRKTTCGNCCQIRQIGDTQIQNVSKEAAMLLIRIFVLLSFF